jgi:hypothetical protein
MAKFGEKVYRLQMLKIDQEETESQFSHLDQDLEIVKSTVNQIVKKYDDIIYHTFFEN